MRWPLTTEQRFWSRVTIAGPDDCWPWDKESSDGYGELYVDGRLEKAHRYSWSLKNGPIPKGKCVLHNCDNPPCVNPSHLFCGTKKQNFDDMVAKGRRRIACGEIWQKAHVGKTTAGERNSHARLKTTDIPIIRKRAIRETLIEIAEDYGVVPTTIGAIVSRRNWRHVP